MEELLFEESPDIDALNAGAHRISPIKLNAPVWINHLSFWAPPVSMGPDASKNNIIDSSPQARILWKEEIDKLIVSLMTRLDVFGSNVVAWDIEPRMNAKAFLFGSVFNDKEYLNRISPTANDVGQTISKKEWDAFRADYRHVTIECAFRSFKLIIKFELHTELLSLTICLRDLIASVEADEHVTALAESLSHLERALLRNPDEETYETAIFKLRQKVMDDIWDKYLITLLFGGLNEAQRIGSLFGDFRGFVYSHKAVKLSEPLVSARKIYPLLGDNKRYECAVSYLLNKRYLHATSLGPQVAETTKRPSSHYIIFLPELENNSEMIAFNQWEIGRLIDSIHVLGTSRLASLRGLNQLRFASREMAILEPLERSAREALSNQVDEDKIISAIADAHRPMSEIYDAIGDIQYRIERSRYYIKRFRTTVERLDISSIDGFQPYNVFVESRLGANFDFIDRLGVRYERSISNLARLDQSNLSLRSNKLSRELKNIQDYGEKLLFWALIPYYLNNLLSHIVPGYGWMGWILTWSSCFGYKAFRDQNDKIDRKIYPPLTGGLYFLGFTLALIALRFGAIWLGIELGPERSVLSHH